MGEQKGSQVGCFWKKVLASALLLAGAFTWAPGYSDNLRAEENVSSPDYHVWKADRYAQEGKKFSAVEEYRRALALGAADPEVHRSLAIALYNLGLVAAAIDEMGKYLAVRPDGDVPHLVMGIFLLVKDRTDAAEKEFSRALELNPGFADAYYYLGETYYRKGDFPRSWLCALMSERLGGQGRELRRKLTARMPEPEVTPWREGGKEIYIRQILVASPEEAKELLNKISTGELFEALAAEKSLARSGGHGGYAGHFQASELDPKLAGVLAGRNPFDDPVTVETPAGYLVLQRIAPFDPAYWDELLSASKPKAPIRNTGDKPSPTPLRKPQAKETGYLVHAGSYANREYAQELLEDLRSHGFKSYIYEKESASTGIRYHVVAGKYPSREEAQAAGRRLGNFGFDFFVIEE